jgi:mitotic spindle assembly checkpoint protein MAD1
LTDPSAEPTSHTPTALTQALSTLRLNYASLLEQQGSVNSLLALREAELAEAVRRDAEARQRCTQLEDAIRKESERALKRERRAALAERESSGLRALMATFTAEETMTEGAFDEVKNRRILQLEELLEDYKTNAVDLEKSLDEASRRGGGEPSRKEVEDAVRAETERRLALKQGPLPSGALN